MDADPHPYRPCIEAAHSLCSCNDGYDRHRPLIATSIFTDCRQGELLGLTWADIDFDGGLVHVSKQLDRSGSSVAPKTPKAIRAVVMMPALGAILRAHRLASRFAADSDPVFASNVGRPLHYRNISRRGLDPALERAGIEWLAFHEIRHTFASLLIAQGGERRLREPAARAREPGHHPAHLLPPLRPGRPRRPDKGRARGRLWKAVGK